MQIHWRTCGAVYAWWWWWKGKGEAMQCRRTPQGGAPSQRWVQRLGSQVLPAGQERRRVINQTPDHAMTIAVVFLTDLKHGIVAEHRTSQCRCAAVTVDQLAALLAPASLFLWPSQAPLCCHSISARGQVAQGYPDWLWAVPHAAAIYHREDAIIHKKPLSLEHQFCTEL